MALTATPDAALTANTDPDAAGDVWPDWHRWFNERTERWWAARTSVPIGTRSDVMLISTKTYSELLTAVVHASGASVKAA